MRSEASRNLIQQVYASLFAFSRCVKVTCKRTAPGAGQSIMEGANFQRAAAALCAGLVER